MDAPLLHPRTSALVVIDLQRGVVARPCAPYSAAEVVANAARLADAFRAAGAWVALVRVGSVDGEDTLHPITDAGPQALPPRPSDWSEIVPELGPRPGDFVLTKHQWGAFYGTELDLQLRRRGLDTIVLCGIATGYGVDTTAREAYQRGYQQIFATDAMTGLSEEEHRYVCAHIFPRIGRLRSTAEIVRALAG